MKKIIVAAILALSPLAFGAHAATEINHNFKGELEKIGSVSVSGGTLDELTQKLAHKAERAEAEFFRITSANTDERGYATATLYISRESQS